MNINNYVIKIRPGLYKALPKFKNMVKETYRGDAFKTLSLASEARRKKEYDKAKLLIGISHKLSSIDLRRR